jgi:hypothetical protein
VSELNLLVGGEVCDCAEVPDATATVAFASRGSEGKDFSVG